MSKRTRSLKAAAVVTGVASLLLTAAPANAAPYYSFTANTKVSGQTVSFKSTVKASQRTNVSQLGICIRDSKLNNLDLPAINGGRTVTLSKTATTLTGTVKLKPGKYAYGVCFYKDRMWQGEEVYGKNVRTVTVPSTSTPAPTPTPTPTPVPTPTPAPSTSVPKGDITSNGTTWTPVMTQDFTANAATGEVPTKYNNSFPVYPDGTGDGKYLPGQTLSVHDSMLDLNLKHIGNVDAGAAGQFIQPNGEWAYTGGRFDIRFKASGNPAGYGAAFMLWPENNNWGEGEIDFPEGELTSKTNLYQHALGANPYDKTLQAEGLTNWSDWHTATVEWLPGKTLRYYMDGKLVGQETNPKNVPTTPHAWVVQAAAMDQSANGAPDASNGHLYIDWAVAYAAK